MHILSEGPQRRRSWFSMAFHPLRVLFFAPAAILSVFKSFFESWSRALRQALQAGFWLREPAKALTPAAQIGISKVQNVSRVIELFRSLVKDTRLRHFLQVIIKD
jgi:hypothetical protein